jgi:hypothetical protein
MCLARGQPRRFKMEEQKTKRKISKKILLTLLGVLLIGSVLAGVFMVRSHSLANIAVKEAFTVQFAVLPSSGSCASATWETATSTTIGDLYPGEGKLVCIRVKNDGGAQLHYTIASVYTGTNVQACTTAFGAVLNDANTLASGATVDKSILIKIDEGAPPFLTPCTLTISVSRGTA